MFFLASPLIICACAGDKKIVFHPEPDPVPEQAESLESGQIIETQNGSADAPIPEWLGRFLDRSGDALRVGGIRQVEALGAYGYRYVFIAENRGTNLHALRQWADRFTVAQDFPRLAALRIEKRLLAAASLYPDDEYGDFFEELIKNASDAEYPEAVKEEIFWIKRRTSGGETAPEPDLYGAGEAAVPAAPELYAFFVLISIDKDRLRARIQELLAQTQAGVHPTREQAAAIYRLRQHFFEGF